MERCAIIIVAFKNDDILRCETGEVSLCQYRRHLLQMGWKPWHQISTRKDKENTAHQDNLSTSV